MLLKVGQLAKQVCLSIRTLHHYDEIGLLSPSVRTSAGHRLYNTKDIARLHRIQALKKLGLPLQKIADLIQKKPPSLPDIIAQQIEQLERELLQAEQLKARLIKLQNQLKTGDEPDMTAWLDTLALLNVYEKYLTADEIEALNSHALAAKHDIENEWPEMVKKLQAMMDLKVAPGDKEAQEFIVRWTEMLERLVGHNPNLLLKVHAMSGEVEMQVQRCISPAMIAYLGDAMGALHREIFTKYLSPQQMQHLDKNRQKNREEWPPLISAIREKIQAGVDPKSDELRPLALKWKTLFERSTTGGDSDMTEKLRNAYACEPLLMQGTGLDQMLLDFIRQATSDL